MTEFYGIFTKIIMRWRGGGAENGNRQVENWRHYIFQKASLRNETWHWTAISDTMMRYDRWPTRVSAKEVLVPKVSLS